MKKLFSTIFATLLSLSLILTGFTFTVQADDLITETEKISCNATLDDNFADNRVLVVLTREASLEFNTYTANSFASLGCTKVTDLSTATGAMARTAMEQATAMLRSGESLNLAAPVEHSETISNYKQVLCLELNQSGKQNVLDTIKVLMQRDDVIYAGPDYAMELRSESSVSPNDTYYNSQWAVDQIDLPYAWDITTGSSNVVVGILDSGIEAGHLDLANNVSVSLSRDFTTGSAAPVSTLEDELGHGTQVAGVIGARGNNGNGVAGVCWNVTLVSLDVVSFIDYSTIYPNLNAGYYIYASWVISAISYATSIGIDILNFSGGWLASSDTFFMHFDYGLQSAISNYPGLFVCAVNNDNINNDSGIDEDFPANFDLPNLIAVGSSTQNDTKYSTSGYGQTSVDLFAPGDNIYTTTYGTNSQGIKNCYSYATGTSFATPLVSGVAALMLSVNGSLTPSELKTLILGAVDEVAALEDLCVSGGRLNAYEAVAAAQNALK